MALLGAKVGRMGEERRVAGHQIKGEPGDHGVRVGQGISGGDCGGRCRAGSRRGRWVRQVGSGGQRGRRARVLERTVTRERAVVRGRAGARVGLERGNAGWARVGKRGNGLGPG